MIRVFSIVSSCSGENGITAGFSNMVAEKLSQRAADLGESIEYECITGDTIRLSFCRSCNNCFNQGVCPLDKTDDMAKIKEKLLAADIIFFCSPVYLAGMSGFAKCVIDRMAYVARRFELAGKTAAVLVSTSYSYGKETAEEIKKALQFMGASVAYAGYVCRSRNNPNIYIPEQMDKLTDEISDRLLASLEGPGRFIEVWQDQAFIIRKKINRRALLMNEIAGVDIPDEVKVCTERGYGQYKTLSEYVSKTYNGWDK